MNMLPSALHLPLSLSLLWLFVVPPDAWKLNFSDFVVYLTGKG